MLLMADEIAQGGLLQTPCLYVRGLQDTIVQSEEQLRQNMAKLFHSFDIVNYEGGHWPPMKPADWKPVDAFLDRHLPGAS